MVVRRHVPLSNVDKPGESGLVLQISIFCVFLTGRIIRIALTGWVLRPIPRFSLLTGEQLVKERLDETHLSAKRTSTQTPSWIPLSDVNR